MASNHMYYCEAKRNHVHGTFFGFKKKELGGLIPVVAGAIATVLFALQKSSCTDIRCCGLACRRDPALIAQAREDGSSHQERRHTAEPEPEPEVVP